MTLIASIPLLVSLLGAALYVLSLPYAKVAEIGRIMFACGLLVALFAVAGHVVSLPR